MSDKKLLLKETLSRNRITKYETRILRYKAIFETRSFEEEHLKNFQKQGDYAHSQGDGEK